MLYKPAVAREAGMLEMLLPEASTRASGFQKYGPSTATTTSSASEASCIPFPLLFASFGRRVPEEDIDTQRQTTSLDRLLTARNIVASNTYHSNLSRVGKLKIDQVPDISQYLDPDERNRSLRLFASPSSYLIFGQDRRSRQTEPNNAKKLWRETFQSDELLCQLFSGPWCEHTLYDSPKVRSRKAEPYSNACEFRSERLYPRGYHLFLGKEECENLAAGTEEKTLDASSQGFAGTGCQVGSLVPLQHQWLHILRDGPWCPQSSVGFPQMMSLYRSIPSCFKLESPWWELLE